MNMKDKTIVVVASHADDEILGCGGTLSKWKDQGAKIYWLLVTEPKGLNWNQQQIENRNTQISLIHSALFEDVIRLDFSATKLNTENLLQLIHEFHSHFQSLKPQVILSPSQHDVHTDHKYCYQAAISASKKFRLPQLELFLTMEILSETNFCPDMKFCPQFYVDISQYLDEKIRLIKVYQNEMGEHPFPRSIESIKALATIRGSESNCIYAESFAVVKMFDSQLEA